jgi:hypothetical protein
MSRDLEHQEQVALFNWSKLDCHKHPELKLMFAIPNGGQRNIIVASKLKAEGVKAGVPDICLPVARQGFSALYIELKAIKGRMQPNQIEWQTALNEAGNMAVTCHGWVAARETILAYLNGGK